MWKQNLCGFPQNKNDGKLQVSSSRPGAVKDAHSCLRLWETLRCLPAVGSLCLSCVQPPDSIWGKDGRAGIPRLQSHRCGPRLFTTFYSEKHANHEGPPSPPSNRLVGKVHLSRGPSMTGWSSCQSSGHPARMQPEY